MRKRQTVEQWIATVAREVVDGRGLNLISLCHMKGMGNAREEVHSWPIQGPVNPKELENDIIGRAQNFGQDLPGLQTFKLIAFYGDQNERDPFIFTTSDGLLTSRTEIMMPVHEPTATGALGQAMKLIEVMMEQNKQLTQSNMATANGLINTCLGPQGAITQFMHALGAAVKAQLEAAEVVKDTMLDMSRQQREMQLTEHKAVQDLQTRKAIIDAIPQLVNRATGHEVFDETANRAKMLEMIATSISPTDIDILVQLGKITKEQALVMSAQFAAIVKEKQKEAEARRRVPSESLPPTQNGSGNRELS